MTLTAITQEFHQVRRRRRLLHHADHPFRPVGAFVFGLLAARITYAWAMAATAATVFTLCAVVAALGRERRGIVYGASPGTATG